MYKFSRDVISTDFVVGWVLVFSPSKIHNDQDHLKGHLGDSQKIHEITSLKNLYITIWFQIFVA